MDLAKMKIYNHLYSQLRRETKIIIIIFQGYFFE